MADNYLERQRELYEVRKAEWLKNKSRIQRMQKAKKATATSNNDKTGIGPAINPRISRI